MPAVPPNQWLTQLIGNLLYMVVWPVFAGLVVVMFIWAGILFLTAQGDPTKISLARKAVIWAMVGIIIGILGFSAVAIIQRFIP